MASSGDDARKKRQVDPSGGEKPKKVRVDSSSTNARRLLLSSSTKPPPSLAPRADGVAATSNATGKSTSPVSLFSASKTQSSKKIWDIESALLYLVQVEGDFTEYLTHDKSTWVTFRVGHAGDASTIASWYRRAKQMAEEEDEEENPELDIKPARTGEEEEETTSNMLEVWLADGMGDEGNPPSLFSLVAHVHKINESPANDSKESSPSNKTTTKSMGAAALLTITFADKERVLRVEWMGMHPGLSREVTSILQQRMWLRLSTLSVMTACQVVEVDRQQTINALEKSDENSEKASTRLRPSAE
jgi:hypothetical protein